MFVLMHVVFYYYFIIFFHIVLKKNYFMDFSGGPVVKNMWSSNAEDTGSTPGLGTKIPHAMGQQSPWAATKIQGRQVYKYKKNK